tara:strand:- start:231 stop:554 length:324 start_codon:yes stop_codon:yes gene_type:complete
MENLIKNYFTFFSKKDISSLDKLLADDVKLIDWEISANGKKEVLDANKKIFSSFKSIDVELKEIFIKDMTVVCLLEILVNNKDKIKVVDIIKFNNDNKIILISAFKQ